ncbi:hypothetical protein [Raoultella terrigena]|uniref:hypothetical protein n=1 Tax=Raoultella terrigena TaxID=577 RepID=UPI00384BEE53
MTCRQLAMHALVNVHIQPNVSVVYPDPLRLIRSTVFRLPKPPTSPFGVLDMLGHFPGSESLVKPLCKLGDRQVLVNINKRQLFIGVPWFKQKLISKSVGFSPYPDRANAFVCIKTSVKHFG